MILCIDTATSICTVALCRKGELVDKQESTEERSHAAQLTVLIEKILKKGGIKTTDLDAIAVSKGPGSYTGLRIGVSAAKGIAYASNIPLIAIATPLLMYYGAVEPGKYDYYCPMIDARRMEVYTAVYDSEGRQEEKINARVIDENSFSAFLEKGSVLFFGDGAEKCKGIIKHKSAYFSESFRISAAYMCKPAFTALENKDFEDVAYFEPFYLKDFIATIPKKNILGGKTKP